MGLISMKKVTSKELKQVSSGNNFSHIEGQLRTRIKSRKPFSLGFDYDSQIQVLPVTNDRYFWGQLDISGSDVSGTTDKAGLLKVLKEAVNSNKDDPEEIRDLEKWSLMEDV